ncbi:MAG: membrane protein insertion efficiency factor YidD [Myxococcales bacterium]|nr:membrane protein insertion efficiency factor YidD [Myxococcales bacterium]TDI97096.1 MAG: membrane protein insertion efficiency factor YidD [Deltaproteobacteria bacterium]TDJ06819.1 MAG: membrane protein insertion efficiency factor YidD [Deltaproteobacteria bacterium]
MRSDRGGEARVSPGAAAAAGGAGPGSGAGPHSHGQRVLIGAIRLYQGTLSPLLGSSCRYYPSCSEYAIQVVARDGVWRGAGRALRRVLRCAPLIGGGLDLP